MVPPYTAAGSTPAGSVYVITRSMPASPFTGGGTLTDCFESDTPYYSVSYRATYRRRPWLRTAPVPLNSHRAPPVEVRLCAGAEVIYTLKGDALARAPWVRARQAGVRERRSRRRAIRVWERGEPQ